MNAVQTPPFHANRPTLPYALPPSRPRGSNHACQRPVLPHVRGERQLRVKDLRTPSAHAVDRSVQRRSLRAQRGRAHVENCPASPPHRQIRRLHSRRRQALPFAHERKTALYHASRGRAASPPLCRSDRKSDAPPLRLPQADSQLPRFAQARCENTMSGADCRAYRHPCTRSVRERAADRTVQTRVPLPHPPRGTLLKTRSSPPLHRCRSVCFLPPAQRINSCRSTA